MKYTVARRKKAAKESDLDIFAVRNKKTKKYARNYGPGTALLLRAMTFYTSREALEWLANGNKKLGGYEVVKVTPMVEAIDMKTEVNNLKETKIREIRKRHSEALKRELAKFK
jgi:hypothetical protein